MVVTRPMLADAHLDLAWNALERDRDLAAWAITVRARELGTLGPGRAQGMLSWPDLATAGVAVAIATLRAPVDASMPVPDRCFPAVAQAHAVARGHLAYYQALARGTTARIVESASGLAEHLDAWRTASRGVPRPVGLVLSLSCADPVLDAPDLERWHADGVRILGLAHPGEGRFAGGARSTTGLQPSAAPILERAAALGLALDLADVSDATFDEALAAFPGTVFVSHGSCRRRSAVPEALDDVRLRALVERGGILALTLRADRLAPRGAPGPRTLDDLIDHVDHVADLIGSVDAVAIGSDVDDPEGSDAVAAEIETIADLPRIAEALARRGYGDDDVTAIVGGNLLRFLASALKG